MSLVWLEFAEHLKEYRSMIELVLEGENKVAQAKLDYYYASYLSHTFQLFLRFGGGGEGWWTATQECCGGVLWIRL